MIDVKKRLSSLATENRLDGFTVEFYKSFFHILGNDLVDSLDIDNVNRRLFRFLWNNRRDKIRRAGLYQEYAEGRLRMVDVETMMKSLRLVWIPRFFKPISPRFQAEFLLNWVEL